MSLIGLGGPEGLEALERRIRSELQSLNFPLRDWMPRSNDAVLDVVVVGGGQSGMGAAFGLMREKVRNVLVLDKAPAGHEGVWRNFARMETLRTHKQASGLDFGLASLTPQAWYTAQFGEEKWAEIQKIPREIWHDYLLWYRKILNLPVRNDACVKRIRPDGRHLLIELADGQTLVARKVILATGLAGSGKWYLPPIAASLPRHSYAHTEEQIDFDLLKGKRVGVLGGGASAFDNAATALETGAFSVDLNIRIPSLPRINPNKWLESAGFLGHFVDLDDEHKWRFMRQLASMNQPPPQETLWRCSSHDNFTLKTGVKWHSAEWLNSEIAIQTPDGVQNYDFLIFGTGIENALHERPELKEFVSKIALWKDRFKATSGDEDDYLSNAPYLGRGFEFIEKNPGEAPFLKNIHNFTFGATPSQGLSAASISGMKYGLQRLVSAIVKDFFVEDADLHLAGLRAYSDREISFYQPGVPIDTWEERRMSDSEIIKSVSP